MAARLAKSKNKNRKRTLAWPVQGQTLARVSAMTLEIAAQDSTPTPNQRSVETRKPARGPNAASTHAYAPPLPATRLPPSAKQRKTKPTRMEQRR
jgi:hypothetical protein